MVVRILVVDDSEDARDLTEGALLAAGYNDLLMASSGWDALTVLENFRTADGRPAIDLVLLDIVMPEMDGIEVCERIRKDERCADVPIIMVTSLDDMSFLIDAFEAGADDYLTKPINRVELVARARGTLRDTKPPISHIRQLGLPAQAGILAGLWLIAAATLAYIL
jgi:sigma-B regulation protein RsbU (phosphoserine phosphatase)